MTTKVLAGLLNSAGFGSRRALADAIGLDPVKFSKTLHGTRRLQAVELMRMARALGVGAEAVWDALQ
jgi:plasmid maintenance system antidote protein VapI